MRKDGKEARQHRRPECTTLGTQGWMTVVLKAMRKDCSSRGALVSSGSELLLPLPHDALHEVLERAWFSPSVFGTLGQAKMYVMLDVNTTVRNSPHFRLRS